MPKHRLPSERPTKTCPVCGKPFSWRKKWERNWEQVIYCSDACRRTVRKPPPRSSDT
ncbi:DUF2256 domain-containing protein [bacterium]|nr:DUF2256 domain-containing protein [bacterium]